MIGFQDLVPGGGAIDGRTEQETVICLVFVKLIKYDNVMYQYTELGNTNRRENPWRYA